jgi:polar amino acid transport system substrate-binding protein
MRRRPSTNNSNSSREKKRVGNLKRLVLAIAVLACAATAASAQNLLDDIIKRGVINIGVGLGTPPYGLTNEKMEPDGYDVSLGKLIARDLGVKVNLVDTVASARIPNLLTRKLDIVIYSFSITPERAKAIAFSNTVYVDQQVMLAPKATKFAALADLVSHKVGVTRSTTNDNALTSRAIAGTTIQRYDDDASTSQALIAGQVEGIVTSGALAAAMVGRDPNLEVKFPVASAPMGIGLPRGEADLLHWLNTDIFMLWTTGELPALQRKWMGVANSDLPRF